MNKKNNLIYVFIFLFLISGCGEKEENIDIQIIPPVKVSTIETSFESPLESYFKNQSSVLKEIDDSDDMKRTIDQILKKIRANETDDAIKFIEEKQRIESNAYNQLILHQMKSFCYYRSRDKTRYRSEMFNFFQLYNRILSNYSNKQ